MLLFLGHLSNHKVTQSEKLMIWLQFECFQKTQIGIHRWLWNDTHGFWGHGGVSLSCSDMVPNDGVTQKPKIFPSIWIMTENPSWNGPLVQHWFRQWLVSWWPQAITWTTVDSSIVGILAFTGIMGDHNVHYSTHLFSVTQISSFYFSVKRCCNHVGILEFTLCYWIKRKQTKKQAWDAMFNS